MVPKPEVPQDDTQSRWSTFEHLYGPLIFAMSWHVITWLVILGFLFLPPGIHTVPLGNRDFLLMLFAATYILGISLQFKFFLQNTIYDALIKFIRRF